MGIGFNWFKDYKIHIHNGNSIGDYDYVKIEYVGGGSTSHSAGNIIRCQNLLEECFNKRIPVVYEGWIESEEDDLELINPAEMSAMCAEILRGTRVDEEGVRNRFEMYKKHSDDGYYLSYDLE